MFDRQLAKWHLEQQGYLAAVDVALDGSVAIDAFGVRINANRDESAVFGVVRGWWHVGAYLTPSLIRSHLQSDRKLLERAFATERLEKAARQFRLSGVPEKVLFYSMRSPSLAGEAEEELKLLGIRVVYLEDILAEALAGVKYDERAQGTVFQALAMVKGSSIFKEMARLARQAEREPLRRETETDRPSVANRQMNLLLSFADEEDEANGSDAP